MTTSPGSVDEYLASLRKSERFGPQVRGIRTVPAREGEFVRPGEWLSPPLRRVLEGMSIKRLYSHQEEAIRLILDNSDVLVATPTASGKSLIYNLPVFRRLLADPASRALYLFPLKALARNQLQTIRTMADLLPQDLVPENWEPAAIYDGDTTGYRRKKIRDRLPSILITNPDMLHLALLPRHEQWSHLFAHLSYIVLDEVHTYRGMFGSHMAWVIRRLQRICSLHGSRPVFILSSATVGNPERLAKKLIGRSVTVVDRSGSMSAPQHLLLLNPLDSPPVTASMLLQAAVHRQLRTIVYTSSRKMTELIAMWTERRLAERKHLIASYRAGFLPEDRRRIEDQLSRGDLLGVIATSALELGIDIGDLDICLLVGYPGSMMGFRQRAGRVGRGSRPSLVVLVAGEDALDQYFMRHPEAFFQRPVEEAVLNPDNPVIVASHLVCAAAEHPLGDSEPLLCGTGYTEELDRLTKEGRLLQSADGSTWFSSRKFPQRRVNLRGCGATYRIVSREEKASLGEIDAHRVTKDCHPGAVYLHMAKSWEVCSLDLEIREVVVSAIRPHYHTRPVVDKNTRVLEVLSRLDLGTCTVCFGKLRVTEQVSGYWKILSGSQRVIDRLPLDLPPNIFETEGLWIEIPEHFQEACRQRQLHFMGGIHALEHALIGTLPLLAICDRNDIGGISCPWHEQVQGAAVFLYDGYPGGAGLTKTGYRQIQDLLRLTGTIVRDCGCETGCPGCVHSPKCGSGNRPIDKQAAGLILQGLVTPTKGWKAGQPRRGRYPAAARQSRNESSFCDLPERYGVFDVETRRSAAEVGGWHRAEKMGISVAVLYDGKEDRFLSFEENRVEELIDRLFSLELVVGFNNKRFDNRVLSAYTDRNLAALPSLDILEEITSRLGYRLSLDRLAEHTLGIQKSGNGLLALQWFREGKMDLLTSYCRKDVALTKDLFLFGLRQRHLLFRNKAGQVVRLPVDFGRTIQMLLAGRKACQGQTSFL